MIKPFALFPHALASAAALGLALTVPAMDGRIVLVDEASVPSLAYPAERAAALGLAAPSGSQVSGRTQCSYDIDGVYPTACFATRADVGDYLARRSRRTEQQGTVMQLSGSGGTPAGSSGTQLGMTCTQLSCASAALFYTASGSNCTHAYPENDYFAENVAAFTYAENFARGSTTLNCNRLALYRDGIQSGAGAISCSVAVPCGGGSVTFRSLSWHNG